MVFVQAVFQSPTPHSPRGFAVRLSAPPPILYFACAYNTASYAGYINLFNVAPNLNQGAILQGPKAVTPTPLNPVMLTSPPTEKSPSPMSSPPNRKRQRIHFVNYLDDDESIQIRRSRRLKSQSHAYKYAKKNRKLEQINKQKFPMKIKTEFIRHIVVTGSCPH